MNEANKHVRNGMGAVRPFIYGRLDLLDFVKHVFGAVELERNKVDKGFHVQAQIGDSVVVLFGNGASVCRRRAPRRIVYVADVDATYERAIAAGASSLGKPTERPFQERTASVKDAFGEHLVPRDIYGQGREVTRRP